MLPQGKRHQQNLAKRAAREAQDKPTAPAPQRRVAVKKTVKIGRPGYRVTKQFDPDIRQRSLLFQVPTATSVKRPYAAFVAQASFCFYEQGCQIAPG